MTHGRIAAVLFVVTLATRLPLLTSEFWAHDSVLYTRALDLFDPAEHRPQPPGYLYYVLLIRAVHAVVGDPVRAMTLISAVAAAAAVALLYVLSARMYDRRTAGMSAVFLMTSVTFWGESLVALPYTLLAALTITVALLLWRVEDPWADPSPSRGERGRRLALASLAWGIAVGFRSDLAGFLAPAWLLVAMRTSLVWAAASAAIVGTATLAWLAATVALTPGGAERYFPALRQHLDFIDERYSVTGRGVDALLNNVREMARFMGRALFALMPVLAAVLLSRETQRVELREPRRAAFLLLWTLAPLPVNLFVHAGEYGYMFTMVPGLCVIASRGAIGVARAARVPRTLPWVAAAVVAVNAGIFLFSDEPLSRRDVAKRDAGIRERVERIAPIGPREAVIVVTAYDQVLIETLLPGRRVIAYLPDATPSLEIPLTCPRETCAVHAWDEYFRAGSEWRTILLPSGSRLRTAEVRSGTTLRVTDGLTLTLVR